MKNWNAIQANFGKINNAINKNLCESFAIMNLLRSLGSLAEANMVYNNDNNDLMLLRTMETTLTIFAYAVVAYANAINIELEDAVSTANTVVNFDKVNDFTTAQYIYRLAQIILDLTNEKHPVDEKKVSAGLLIIYLERISLKNNLEFAKLVAA